MNAETKMNGVYEPLLGSTNRYELIFGGAGSGKSFFAAQKIVLKIIQNKGYKWLVARKVGRTNRHSTFALIRDVIAQCGITHLFKVNKTDMEITAHNGNQIIFVGLDDVSKLKSIAGITNMWIEEATELSKEDFTQLDLRLRGATKHAKQIILTFNPVSAHSWVKARFFDQPDENVQILQTTYRDNRFIDEQYKEVIEELKNQDETYYQIYALGEWGTPKGLIYDNWKLTNEMPMGGTITYGLDFGFNNPTALVEICEYDQEIYVRELLHQTHLTNAELIDRMKDIGVNGRVYCDSAEPNRIAELRAAGFVAMPAKKDVLKGIDHVKSRKLKIHAESTNLIKELQSYKWREDRDGHVLDEPVKFQDHLLDAMRYGLYTGTKSGYTAW